MSPARESIYIAAPAASPFGGVIISPFQFTLRATDHLRVGVACAVPNVDVTVQGRWIDKSGAIGSFSYVHHPTSDRLMTWQDFAIGDGAIMNLVAFASRGDLTLGPCFVVVQLIGGDLPAGILVGTLIQGYLKRFQARAWPGSPIEDSLSGPGFPREITIADPVVGLNYNESVPSGAFWGVDGFAALFHASAVAATRIVYLEFKTSLGRPLYVLQHPTQPIANSAQFVYWLRAPVIDQSAWTGTGRGQGILDHTLRSGSKLETFVDLLQAGDHWETGTLSVREWLTLAEVGI